MRTPTRFALLLYRRRFFAILAITTMLATVGAADVRGQLQSAEPPPAAPSRGSPADQLAADRQDEYGDITAAEAGETAEAEAPQIADPLQRWNRIVFRVNDRLYYWVLKPVTRAYKRVVPEGFRVIFGNFYRNLAAPVRIVNNGLQFRLKNAGTETLRFVVNSTVGAGGLRDIAGDCMGISQRNADFGQTLGFYGLGPGFYIVWPLLGPSSARDTIGYAADTALYPPTWIAPTDVSAGTGAHDRVNNLSFHLGEYESLKKAAIDPYTATRSAYAQYRANLVEQARKDR